MRWTLALLSAAALFMASGAADGAAVQWTVESGGNGHWYEVITAPNVLGTGMGIPWTDAKAAAEAQGGYLVTITSAAETAFINNLISISAYPSYWQNVGWGYFGPWIGAQQNPLPVTFGPSYSNTNWTWVTGEPWGYTNWSNLTGVNAQPNDGHATADGGLDGNGGWEEDKIMFMKFSWVPDPFWCDVANVDPAPPIATGKAPVAYIVEKNGTPNAIFWTGGTSSAWSVTAGSGNWRRDGGAAIVYADGDFVTFDDSASGTTTVDISVADVSPGSVAFNNISKDFVVAGSKGIAGDTTLLKQGSGKVTLGSANSYTGKTTLEGGVLQLNGPGAHNPVLNLGGADIKDGTMVFDYSGGSDPSATIASLLAASFHAGSATHFDVGQFQSSTADGDRALGWKTTSNYQVYVTATLYGDARLDGSVDISDLSVLGQNWNGSGKVWAQGDFNYDGKVDISDLSYLGQHWNQDVAAYSSTTPVPEPGSFVLLAIGVLMMIGCRRRWSGR